MRRFGIAFTVLFGLLLADRAHAVTFTFDSISAGAKINSLYGGTVVTADNSKVGHPDQAIIYDSACPPDGLPASCTGDDTDLKTPGVGIGNDTAQNKLLIIAENLIDNAPRNGLVDKPDDELAGGTLRLAFPKPTKLFSLRIIDIDVNESATRLVLELTGGGTQVVPVAAPGNNSAQTVLIPDPLPTINAFRVEFAGSGGIDDIVFQSCGNNVLESGEDCDGTDSTQCPGQCSTGCMCPVVSTSTSSTSSTSMPPSTTLPPTTTTVPVTTTVPATTTTVPVTTTVPSSTTTVPVTTTMPSSTTTVPVTTSTVTTTTVTTTSTLPPPPRCGDNQVNQASEQCDGVDAGQCPGKPCLTNCLCPVCGNGIVEPGEVCEPPSVGICDANCRLAACPTQTEICNNSIDDNGNGLIDCADPECSPSVPPPCGCARIRKDPARIRFDATKSGADFFSIHGHFQVFGSVDLDNVRFGVLLMNDLGRVYQGSLAAGELNRKKGGKGRYVFRDRRALSGGPGDADGIYRVGTRVLEHNDGVSYLHFRVKVYGDFSAATLPRMTSQIVAGDEVGALTANWRELRNGWVLTTGDYDDESESE